MRPETTAPPSPPQQLLSLLLLLLLAPSSGTFVIPPAAPSSPSPIANTSRRRSSPRPSNVVVVVGGGGGGGMSPPSGGSASSPLSPPSSASTARSTTKTAAAAAAAAATATAMTATKDPEDLNYDGTSSSSMAKSATPPPPPPPPLLTVGVLADIQYAPIPDGFSYGGAPRYYRHALVAARVAAEHFEREGVDCVINLGDVIDGKCQEIEKWTEGEGEASGGGEAVVTANGQNAEGDEKEERRADDGGTSEGVESGGNGENDANPGLTAALEVLDALSAYSRGPVLHAYGNHELYNLDRAQLSSLLGIPFVTEPCGELVGYRSSRVLGNGGNGDGNGNGNGGVRFVILDTYDIAVGGRCPSTSKKRLEAERLLARNNPNFPARENSPEGLDGLRRRYVAFNGAAGRRQLLWLDETLTRATEEGERVMVLSHNPLHPESSNPVCLAWNYDEVLEVLRRHGGTVMASFSGHAHRGGYARCEESGIHFRVFEAALESDDPVRTYGFVDVHEDRVVVRGEGDCMSAVYDLDHMTGRGWEGVGAKNGGADGVRAKI